MLQPCALQQFEYVHINASVTLPNDHVPSVPITLRAVPFDHVLRPCVSTVRPSVRPPVTCFHLTPPSVFRHHLLINILILEDTGDEVDEQRER